MNEPGTLFGIRTRSKRLVLPAVFAFILCADNAPASSQTPSLPTLLIPLGSYLEHENIGLIYVDKKQVYRSYPQSILTFTFQGGIPDPEACWSKGYDLAKGNGTDLICDTSVRLESGQANAARFFYSALPPYGRYVNGCMGILRTRERGRKYLYASCTENLLNDRIRHSVYKPNKLDITNCENDIINDNGVLKCSDDPVKPRHILTGSYLESCGYANSVYDPDTDILQADCKFGLYKLYHASRCIGVGKDIIRIPRRPGLLTCVDSADKNVTQHTASLTLPAGNYLATCQDIFFFPCLGESGQGVLKARCLDLTLKFIDASLEDRDPKCRMSDMRYVSNIGGELECDPDIQFNDEDPTDGSGLQDNLQCHQLQPALRLSDFPSFFTRNR